MTASINETGNAKSCCVMTRNSKVTVSSGEARNDGQPFFQLEQTAAQNSENAPFVARAGSFEYLNKALQLADDQKLKELQEIIQGGAFLRNLPGLSMIG